MAEMSDDDRFEAAAAPFSEWELREIAPFGHERTVATGDVLFRAGDPTYDFFVILENSAGRASPCPSRPRSRVSSPSATSGTVRSSGSRLPSAKARARCGRYTSTWHRLADEGRTA